MASDAIILSYFLPKMTMLELELIKSKDIRILKTFFTENPDVPEDEMKLSESKSKFVNVRCLRESFEVIKRYVNESPHQRYVRQMSQSEYEPLSKIRK